MVETHTLRDTSPQIKFTIFSSVCGCDATNPLIGEVHAEKCLGTTDETRLECCA